MTTCPGGPVVRLPEHQLGCDRFGAASRDHGEAELGGDLADHRRRLGQSGVDAPGVEPARAERAEDVLPVDIAWFQLAGRGVPAVRDTLSTADTEAPFGKSIPSRTVRPQAIGDPADQGDVHPALQHEILNQAPRADLGMN